MATKGIQSSSNHLTEFSHVKISGSGGARWGLFPRLAIHCMISKCNNSWVVRWLLWVIMVKVKLLCDDCDKIAKEVSLLGFQGGTIDLKVKVAKTQKVINDEEKFINEILDTNSMYSTGRLFKLGVQAANATTVTKAGKLLLSRWIGDEQERR